VPIGEDFESVLAAAQIGAEWAIEVLYRELNPRLVRYLRVQTPGAAEDLASEVWLSAAQQLNGFAGSEDAFRGWMFTIARRQVIGHWRKTGRRRTDPVQNDVFAERAAKDDPAQAVVDRLSSQEAVQTMVLALPADQAEVILLRTIAGLDVAQVAEVMGKRPGTIRVLQHRGLRRLAEVFSPEVVTE
jgi:RNA polymerase sigma-70 factor, ECF subfamily